MKRLALTLGIITALCSCSHDTPEPKISIFSQHIESIAKQENISFAQAATLVKAMGYEGVDMKEKTSEEQIRILDSLGFEHASAITYIYFTDGDKTEECRESIAWLKSHGYDRTLLVPGFLKEDFTAGDLEIVGQRIAAYAEMAAQEGILIMLEDYDSWDSPCLNIDRLTTLFSASDRLGHVMDTGNYLFSGDDCLEALDKFGGRVGHVHLKDRVSTENMSCPPVGTGCIPVKEVITRLVKSGYDGWLTVEQFGSKNMLEDSQTSFANVSSFIEEACK